MMGSDVIPNVSDLLLQIHGCKTTETKDELVGLTGLCIHTQGCSCASLDRGAPVLRSTEASAEANQQLKIRAVQRVQYVDCRVQVNRHTSGKLTVISYSSTS